MEIKSLSQLVQLALSDKTNRNAEFAFSKLPANQARVIEKYIHKNLTGSERILTTSFIRHTILAHGDAAIEARRGQIAITLDDFRKVPLILKEPDKIEYKGKNKRNQDVFLYTKKIGNTYAVVEAVRFSNQGDKLVFQTMYKRK